MHRAVHERKTMKRRIIALLLLVCMVCSLAACNDQPAVNPQDTTTAQSGTDIPDGPTDYYADATYTFNKDLKSGIQISNEDGLTDYIILIPTSPSDPTVELEIATTLQGLLWDLYGVRIRIAAATQRPTKLPEILIGETRREKDGVVTVDRSGLGEDGYFVRNYDETIVFAANTDEGLWAAMTDFVRSYLGFDPYTESVAERRDTRALYLPEEVFIRHNDVGTDKISITYNGKDLNKYSVVSGEGAGTVSTILSSALRRLTGGTFNTIYTSKSNTITDYELVIGQSNRDGKLFNIDYSTIGEHECAVFNYGNRIIFAANNPVAYRYGVEQFIEEYFGYIYGEKFPTSDIELTFEEGLIKTYTVSSTFHSFTCGTVDYDSLFADNMYKMAGTGSVCYSDAKTLTKVLARSRTQAKYGDVNLAFVPDDSFCTCDACKQAAEEIGSPYGAYYKLIQDVADAFIKENISSALLITAYRDTFDAPNMKFTSNVHVTLADRNLCSKHCIGDASCKINAAFAENLDAWIATGASVSVCDFTSAYIYYPVTFPNFMTVYQNIQYYSKKGIQDVYLHFNEVQASLENGELRSMLYTAAIINTNMTQEQYRAAMLRYAKQILGEKDGQLLCDYIDLMTSVTVDHCYTVSDLPQDIMPIESQFDESTGHFTYDLSVPSKAYAIWNTIHPYNKTLSQSKLLISQYLFNNYQGTTEARVYDQFAEWLQFTIDIRDQAVVYPQIFEAAKNIPIS